MATACNEDWSSFPNHGEEERNKMWERRGAQGAIAMCVSRKQIRLKAINFTNPTDDRRLGARTHAKCLKFTRNWTPVKSRSIFGYWKNDEWNFGIVLKIQRKGAELKARSPCKRASGIQVMSNGSSWYFPYLELPLVKTVFTNSEQLGSLEKDLRDGQQKAFG